MKCFLCGTSANVKQFNKLSYDKCVQIAQYRNVKGYKYGDIVLPSAEKAGYHLVCRSKFFVLKSTQKLEMDNMFSENKKQARISTAARKNNQGIQQTNASSQSYEQNSSTKTPEFSSNHVSQDVEMKESANDVPPTAANEIPDACLFCHKVIITKAGQRYKTSICSDEYIKQQVLQKADALGNDELSEKLINCSSFSYHKPCKLSFYREYEKLFPNEKPRDSYWHVMRDLHKKCFTILQAFIDIEIFEKNKILFLQDVTNRYISILIDNSSEFTRDDFKNCDQRSVSEKLKNCYGNSIAIACAAKYNNKKIIYKTGMNIEDLMYKVAAEENSDKLRFQNVAYELRQYIKDTQKNEIDQDSPGSTMNENRNIPELLLCFISNLIQGPDVQIKESTDDFQRIKSICNDITFMISKGH